MKLLSISLFALFSTSLGIPNPVLCRDVAPLTAVIDGARLVANKAALQANDPVLTAALKNLVTEANSWLGQGPWTVANKTQKPPNGSINDYASQAPYWWPSDTANGCPYIQRDGIRNPEVDVKYPDHGARDRMFRSSYILSLAWYYTGDARYAQHASLILQTWFINPATAMTPHLLHAQIIPCRNDGRAIGIIDFSMEYTNVVDAAAILAASQAPGWTAANQKAFRDWNVKFLNWLVNSSFGKEEAADKNNHGTFAQMQIAAIAQFLGNTTVVQKAAKVAQTLINSQIKSDGTQPLEFERTRSWHYANFNLGAHLRLALIAKKINVDLFNYKGSKGGNLIAATNFLLDAAVNGSSAWDYDELSFKQYAATDNIQASADAGNAAAKAVVSKLTPPPGGNLFVLRPAPEQLDNISG